MRKYLVLLCLVFTFKHVSYSRNDWFLLHNLKMQYTCNCENKIESNYIPKIFFLRKKDENSGNTKTFRVVDIESNLSIEFKLKLKWNKVYLNNSKTPLFNFKDPSIAKSHELNSSISLFGDLLTLKKIYTSPIIGDIHSYDIELQGGSSLDSFFYGITVNLNYGIFSFSFYDGESKFFCELNDIKNILQNELKD